MGYNHPSIYNNGQVQLIIFLIFLVISSSTKVGFVAEGRAIFKRIEDSQIGGERKLIMRGVIGSSPPRCERRCRTCGHCEAVQVPVVPHDDKSPKMLKISSGSGGSEGSYDYKPMSWKCKCGNMFYNP